jgi:hypothetical protein
LGFEGNTSRDDIALSSYKQLCQCVKEGIQKQKRTNAKKKERKEKEERRKKKKGGSRTFPSRVQAHEATRFGIGD